MAAFPISESDVVSSDQLVVRAAASSFLGRYRGQTRVHTDSDLRVFLRWCTDQDLNPLTARRADVERYGRWLREVRRYQPSTVSRRLSVVVGFYRVCVIDAILEHSQPTTSAAPPCRPNHRPLASDTCKFEALITTARQSTNPNDFALIALLGLLGLRIFEACGASITDLSEEQGHRVLRVHGKGGKVVLAPRPPAVARAIDRAVEERLGGPILRSTIGARMDRHAATRRLKHLAATADIRMPRMHPHMLRHTFVTTMLDAGVSLRDVQIAARHADPKTTMRYDRARKNLDRHPNYILAAYTASGT
ncbi:site-specific recombinase XerD [Krasilnikovia cinnamomea]|uniref:Site-specific recombinase XerD n=1 Tax=Krasilnikovia cinnamomea TaxID=349313 RepID=A0A4Q7ZGS9_9ACTN|nr:tyrosine-type recombinase/integrase [Krasilnikovia cinnamomea]RZU49355.1 site-specific recombinase XerD [Krasilnikovia cinnamomea]